jgi:hypothetical protein
MNPNSLGIRAEELLPVADHVGDEVERHSGRIRRREMAPRRERTAIAGDDLDAVEMLEVAVPDVRRQRPGREGRARGIAVEAVVVDEQQPHQALASDR